MQIPGACQRVIFTIHGTCSVRAEVLLANNCRYGTCGRMNLKQQSNNVSTSRWKFS
jgi:hypothetical protein